MKPLLLEMEAFGSFAEHTAIDFRRFHSGLFLLSGKIGSGKTTVFDAIVFALYGVPSGNYRDAKDMHSNYTPKSTDSTVSLAFSHQGKEYTVKRTIKFTKVRGKNEYHNPRIDAWLYEPDAPVMDGSSKVTARITEIIGMDKAQFCQIVMLAQGEFKKFLRSGSSEKADILGRLYDDSQYKRYEELLTLSAKKLSEQRADAVNRIAFLMEQSFIRPENTEEYPESWWLAGDENLLQHLEDLTAADRKQMQEAEKERASRQEAEAKQIEAYVKAEENNKQLDELDARKEHLNVLESQKETYTALEKEYNTVFSAWHRVSPEIRITAESAARVSQTQEQIRTLKEQKEAAEKALADAEKESEEDDLLQKESERLSGEIRSLEDTLPVYQELKQAEEALNKRKKALDDQKNTLRKTEDELLKAQKKQTDGTAELQSLAGADQRKNNAERMLEKLEQRQKELSGEKGLLERAALLHRLEKQLTEKQKQYDAEAYKAYELQQKYNDLHTRYLSGQSVVLAQQLKEQLDSSGEADCPVCGTRFIKGQPLHFHASADRVPTGTELDQAHELFEAQNSLRSKLEKELAGMHSTLDSSRNEALIRAKNLFLEEEESDLLDETFLQNKQTALQEEIQQALETQKKEAQDAARMQKLQEETAALQNRIVTLTGNQKALQASIEAEERALVLSGSELSERQSAMRWPDEPVAKAEISRLTDRKAKILRTVQSHISRKEQAVKEAERVHAQLDTAEKRLPEEIQKHQEDQNRLEQILQETGLGTREAAEALLKRYPDGDAWLNGTAERIRSYRNDVQNTSERIHDLQELTKDCVRSDLNALMLQREQLHKVYEEANLYCSECRRILGNHEEILRSAAKEKECLQGSEHAWKLLSKLADTASGISGDNGVLTFSRYVLGTFFKEIIRMANYRLDILSGGQFELIHVMEGERRNSAAGLDIAVLNHDTEERQDSASLSGGESFIVSLSLALGLSDAVQNRSGGQELDALFIDEGFGSLDDDVLDKAIDVLKTISGNKRLVGIISHVEKLNVIDQKIIVTRGERGSSVTLEGTEDFA
ncbi:MAG: SMC family ATPase [Solobacterium sp.]|nr:SMC family ATPase [Solobacterium sp.]